MSSIASSTSCLAPRKYTDEPSSAAELFAAGVRHFEAGEFEDALESFTQAYRLKPHPIVRVNMANCFEELGRPVEAEFNYERFLSESAEQGGASPDQVEEIKAHPFFRGVDWDHQLQREPPFVPELESKEDHTYFDVPDDEVGDDAAAELTDSVHSDSEL